jgi:demethylmenaquinone methyltransferase/2-methoxy-6-polyprenyl-1,4-benzoquinol methylase
MIGHAAPAAGDTVLDVASGTAGVALQIAARTGARVVGLDLTEQMLRQGQRNVGDSAVSDRIELVAGRAEQLPFPDAAFDGLTFTYLLRYVADPQATLRDASGEPGGGCTPGCSCRPAA